MKRMYRFLTDSRAAALPFAGVMLTMLLMVIGLVYDMGHLYVVKQELQSAADAGASAGAESIFTLNSAQPQPGTTHCDAARSAARDTVKLNKSDGVLLDIPLADAQVGTWVADGTGKWKFTETACTNSVSAVHVITRRTQAVNGAVPTLFARILGRDFTEVTASATAVLGWVKNLKKGGGFPIAVDKRLVPPPGEKYPATFSSSNKDNGCWHTFLDPSSSASDLKKLVNGTKQGDPIGVGDKIDITNGWDTTVLHEMDTQFKLEQTQHESAPGAKDGKWIIILPVIDASLLDSGVISPDKVGNYVQAMEVLGFVAFEVGSIDFNGNPKSVTGWTLGGYVAPGEQSDSFTPGQGSMRASIPRMVY